jgi:hypothetical protein
MFKSNDWDTFHYQRITKKLKICLLLCKLPEIPATSREVLVMPRHFDGKGAMIQCVTVQDDQFQLVVRGVNMQ